MKKIKQVYILILIGILIAEISNAQSNYQKGKVVTADGVILNGFIDYKEWDRNPTSFKFKATPEASLESIFTPKQIESFEIEHLDYFESHNVQISLGRISIEQQLERLSDTSNKTDVVFLRLIRKGNNVNLYSYSDNIKTRYYIQEQEKDDEPVELLVRSRASTINPDKLITDEIYKAQLFEILQQHKNVPTEKLLPLIQKSGYTLPAIVRIVDVINGSDHEAIPVKSKAQVQLYAGINIFSGSASYKGKNELSEGAVSKLSVLPGASAGIDFFINPNIKKVKVRMDMSFSPAKYEVFKSMNNEGGFVKHTFGRYSFAFTPQVIYNFYKSSMLGLNLGAGLTASYSMYSNSIYETHYETPGPGGNFNYKTEVKLEPFCFTIPVRAGITIANRFDIYAQYNIPASVVSSFLLYSVKVNSGSAGINFLF